MRTAPPAGFSTPPEVPCSPQDWTYEEGWLKDTKELRDFPWPLKQYQVKVFGKLYNQPRLITWYGRPYEYSGLRLPAQGPPGVLLVLTRLLDLRLAPKKPFNSVLVNYYRDGQDSVDWHADDEPEIDQEVPIASLSVGSGRVFSFRRHLLGVPQEQGKLELKDGDLLVMPPGAQGWFQHRVGKTKKPVGPRWNFTFRRLHDAHER